MQERINKLRGFANRNQLDAVLVSNSKNRRYYSGFTGSTATLFITHDRAYFITDFRYMEQAKTQCPDYEVVDIANFGSYNHFYAELVKEHHIKRLGAEGTYTDYDTFVALQKELNQAEVLSLNLDSLRMIKTKEEASIIRKANEIAEKALSYVLDNCLKPGVSEKEVAHILQNKMIEFGADGISFETIVASGVRGALPHGVASEKLIEYGDFVTFDFGCYFQGYASDITRTVVVGGVTSKKLEAIYQIVLEAQKRAVAAVKPGVTLGFIDKVARDYITEHGYGSQFGHTTGHCLGLAVHELPRVYHPVEEKVEIGMVFTIEPGIYIPGLGGVRIEDDVYVTETGCERLTSFNKELIIVK